MMMSKTDLDDTEAPFPAHRVDIGFRCPVSQSSSYGQGMAPMYLCPAATAGGMFFHTDIEDEPWIEVDLQQVRIIGQINVYNREGAKEYIDRATPLKVTVSEIRGEWREVAVTFDCFRGRRASKPLMLTYPTGLRARFVRLTAQKRTYLHLDYIEIIQALPELKYGGITKLKRGEDGLLTCTYVHLYSYGLYANFSTILSDIIQISRSLISVTHIDAVRSFNAFKDPPTYDVFPRLCGNIGRDLIQACNDLDFSAEQVNDHYNTLPLEKLKRVIDIALPASGGVAMLISSMAASSGIRPKQTIAVVYRGTDKGTEIQLASIQDYISVCRRVLERHPDYDIFVQTDQAQARDAVVAAFPGRCHFFNEIPVTRGATAIHDLQFTVDDDITKELFAMRMMAAVRIIAECAYVINHTGNTGAWIAFHRGHSDRLYQFDSMGSLVDPWSC